MNPQIIHMGKYHKICHIMTCHIVSESAKMYDDVVFTNGQKLWLRAKNRFKI